MAVFGALTLAQLRTTTRKLVGDVIRYNSSGEALAGPQIWTDPEVNLAINQAILRYCEMTSATLIQGAEVSTTDSVLTLPVDAIKPIAISQKLASGKWDTLPRSVLAYEELADPNYLYATATDARRWCQMSGNTVRLFPGPGVKACKPLYLQAPAPMTADTDTPDVRIISFHHIYLPYGAAAFLLSQVGKGQDLVKSSSMMEAFKGAVAGELQLEGQEPPPPSNGRGQA